ncbi:MAG: (5-formylfuran-3-yl)methyl phosphate synthase, partial [Planctomycetota bacterium]
MPKLLVSVRSVSEADVALRTQSVQILDVKEPLQGSLGAADAATWTGVAEIV